MVAHTYKTDWKTEASKMIHPHTHTYTNKNTHMSALRRRSPPQEKNNISLRFASGHGTIYGERGQQTGGQPHQAPAWGTRRHGPSPPKGRQTRRGHKHKRRLSTCCSCLNLPLTCAGRCEQGRETRREKTKKVALETTKKTKMENENEKKVKK